MMKSYLLHLIKQKIGNTLDSTQDPGLFWFVNKS